MVCKKKKKAKLFHDLSQKELSSKHYSGQEVGPCQYLGSPLMTASHHCPSLSPKQPEFYRAYILNFLYCFTT